jgi:hypothetical protein
VAYDLDESAAGSRACQPVFGDGGKVSGISVSGWHNEIKLRWISEPVSCTFDLDDSQW